MSCVDSAIIKALVEHIGGNPNDIGGSITQLWEESTPLSDGVIELESDTKNVLFLISSDIIAPMYLIKMKILGNDYYGVLIYHPEHAVFAVHNVKNNMTMNMPLEKVSTNSFRLKNMADHITINECCIYDTTISAMTIANNSLLTGLLLSGIAVA